MNNYTVKELLFAIKNKESLESRAAETGNFDIISPVMDAEMAVKNAGFTDRQMYIFKKYYVQDFTLAMIADELGISPNTLHGWIYAVRDGRLDIGAGAHTPDNALTLNEELIMLRKKVKEQEKEINRIKKENAFLEEASAFFAASRLKSQKTSE